MCEETILPNTTLKRSSDVLIIHSRHPLHTLSSAVVGGGFNRVRYVLNRHVNKNYNHPSPEADLKSFARAIGVHEPFVGLMTAAYLEQAHVITEELEGTRVVLVGTIGLSNRIAAGVTPPALPRAGTINMVFLVDAHLSPAAMVNAVMTATEAKTAILQEEAILTPNGTPATGTSTDAIVVACTGRGPAHPYAGPVSPVGWLIARVVRTFIRQHLATHF